MRVQGQETSQKWRGVFGRCRSLASSFALFLVVPLSLLLFLQWPLREWLQRWSREANDVAQIIFAIYVAIAVSYATRRRTHLAADVLASRYPERVRLRLERAAALLVALPWALFILYSSWPSLIQSFAQMESFPETYNPGYFLLRGAVALLAALVAAQAIATVFARRR